jgi:hypothetical protein
MSWVLAGGPFAHGRQLCVGSAGEAGGFSKSTAPIGEGVGAAVEKGGRSLVALCSMYSLFWC